jgi:hypothetical protein
MLSKKFTTEIIDTRLRDVIHHDSGVHAIYRIHKNGEIDYEEMLIQMIIFLFHSKDGMLQSYVKDMERLGCPVDPILIKAKF